MSVELHTVSEPDGNNETTQVATIGGNKPLHRFLRCQPKIIGTVILIIGASSLIIAIAITPDHYPLHISNSIPQEIFLGSMFTICGILYIVTEHNPTKKTVTISLALSIVSILAGFWTTCVMLINTQIVFRDRFNLENSNNMDTEIPWTSHADVMGLIIEAIFMFYSFVGIITLIITSVLAGTALRSTKTQAIVVLTATTTETPVE